MLRPRPLILFFLITQFSPSYAAHAQDQNFKIAGNVVDGLSGVPLAMAEVSIGSTSGIKMQTTAQTDSEGRFAFDHLIPGKYVLSAKAKDYPQQSFQQHDNFSTAIAVGTDLDSENILFRLSANASVGGQVLDEFSEAVRGAQVMLFREGTGSGSESVRMQVQMATDDQGRYRFGRLQAGRYYLAVTAQPWYAQHRAAESVEEPPNPGGLRTIVEQNTALDVVYPVTYYSGAVDPAKASAITLRPGERASADFTLQPVAAVHLRLRIPTTANSQNVGVRLSQTTLGGHEVPLPIGGMNSDKQFFYVDGVPPGRVVVIMDTQPALPDEQRLSWKQEVDAKQNSPIDITEANITVAVGGIVKNIATRPLPPSAAIAIHNQQSGATIFAPIAPDGKFQFPASAVKSGTYDLSLLNNPEFFVIRVAAVGANVSRRNFDVTMGQPVQLSVEVGAGMGRIDGVALRDGKPVGGIMILLVPQDFEHESPLVRRDQSDSDGTFALSVVPGQYTLVAVEKGWDQEWVSPAVIKTWLKAGELVSVAPNGKYSIKVNVQ